MIAFEPSVGEHGDSGQKDGEGEMLSLFQKASQTFQMRAVRLSYALVFESWSYLPTFGKTTLCAGMFMV